MNVDAYLPRGHSRTLRVIAFPPRPIDPGVTVEGLTDKAS
jgi:hypothetical protein